METKETFKTQRRYNNFPPSGKHFRISIFHLSTHRAEIDRKFEKRRIEDSFYIRERKKERRKKGREERDDNALEIRVEYQALLHVASKRIVFYTSSNNAFPFSPPLSLSLSLLLSPCHVFPPLILNVPALNNNGSPLEVGLLENICRFPPLLSVHPFCRDSFVLPHNDASRLREQRSRIERGEPCHLRLLFLPSLFRRFNCCANICLPGIDPETQSPTQLRPK